MEFVGQHRLNAPKEEVWKALNDTEILKASLPGCEALERTGETEMTAALKAKVGPITATFKGKVRLSDMDPPNGYRISGEGSGGLAGFAKGSAEVRLEAEGEQWTVLHYKASAQMGGKLAQIGARLIDATARQIADEFFSRLAKRVGAENLNAAPAAYALETGSSSERTSAATHTVSFAGPLITRGLWVGLAWLAVAVVTLSFFIN